MGTQKNCLGDLDLHCLKKIEKSVEGVNKVMLTSFKKARQAIILSSKGHKSIATVYKSFVRFLKQCRTQSF